MNIGGKIVKLFNFINRLRKPHCAPENLLLLLPSCIQNSQCKQKVLNDPYNCERCGGCKVCDLVELAEKCGCQIAIATGGRLALRLAEKDSVEAIVAVACEKELREGLKGVFPKPSLGVVNLRPHGPCKDTDVDMDEVEEAVKFFLG